MIKLWGALDLSVMLGDEVYHVGEACHLGV